MKILALLGIGRTGHVGFNESKSTLANDAASFKCLANILTSAITQGISTILNSKEIILIATGESKSKIVHKTIELESTNITLTPTTTTSSSFSSKIIFITTTRTTRNLQ
ncbi:hypothetical protein ABK040_006616 [Willaertia magna]